MEEVVAMVLERHPSLKQVTSTTRMALNCEFTKGDTVVRPGDEVAFIPPVSGGSPSHFELCGHPIESHEAVKRLEPIPEEAGGLATFVGIVRRHSLGREVDYLEYEAYGSMATRKMEEIAGEATGKWDILGASIIHRTGRLEIGAVAVSIAVIAAHRAPALEACRYIIDRLKEDVPIWKREQGSDGETWWGKGP
jgi:MoaE-MoaD fusion protein